MYRAPDPPRNCLLAGLRRRRDSLFILGGKANLEYTAHRFALRQLWPSRLLARFTLLAQGF